MKKSVKNFTDLPYQLRLQNDYDKLCNDLEIRKNDLIDIDKKIKEKQSYVSSTQLLIWRRQRRAVNESIKQLKVKIDLHPLNSL